MPLPASPPSAAVASDRFDRSGAERDDELLMSRVLNDPATRVLLIRRDAAPIVDGRLGFISVGDVLDSTQAAAPIDSDTPSTPGVAGAPGAPDSPSAPRAQVTPVASGTPEMSGVPSIREWAFLGRDGEGRAIALGVLADDAPDDIAPSAIWTPLRAAGGDLPETEAELLTTAVALAGWLRDTAFCPACGARTELRHAGWSRHCPACGREHFPRTDPAVIVLVVSAESDDRVLLGANAAWAGQRYSCFAGFAEAGESLEDAVIREVQEESGVRLREIAYRGSQAWPYPRSLMLGFRARVVDDGDARPDGDEIVEVRWFTRDEIGAALRGEGEVQLPGSASIARRLIDEWYRGVA